MYLCMYVHLYEGYSINETLFFFKKQKDLSLRNFSIYMNPTLF